MSQKPLTELTDQELLREAKKRKNNAIIDAFIVGFLIGIIAYSIVTKSLSLLTLIPVYLIYKFVNKPKYDKQELAKELKARGLK
ncbi:FUSC family protein [Marinoscillum pacificum]|uniref:FUSC family protein n=1 Tax=Marinoscillum pacificum TaxID=392723 RepID=UPI002157ED81|nr:FUSC family protein [Marinoscillum pacificum]